MFRKFLRLPESPPPFPEVDPYTVEVDQSKSATAVVATAPMMNYRCDWKVYCSSVCSKLSTDICIFKIKEKLFIKSSYSLKDVASHDHAASAEIGDIDDLAIISFRHDIPVVISS